ncbi:GNAT family N-acetyltransferase [Parabacteroides sp.]
MAVKIPSSDINYSVHLLSAKDDLSKFSCGDKELDKFFHEEVLLCMKYKYVTAYCVKNQNGSIISLFTLAHDTVILFSEEEKEEFISDSSTSINEEYINTFEKQSAFPAVNIGHLAVRKELQSGGIGTFVINFVTNTFVDYKISGCQFITVDSINNSRTNRFYEKNGFIYQTNNDMYKPTRRMYLPLKIYQDE